MKDTILPEIPALELKGYGIVCLPCIRKNSQMGKAAVEGIVFPDEKTLIFCEFCHGGIELSPEAKEVLRGG